MASSICQLVALAVHEMKAKSALTCTCSYISQQQQSRLLALVLSVAMFQPMGNISFQLVVPASSNYHVVATQLAASATIPPDLFCYHGERHNLRLLRSFWACSVANKG